MKIYKIIIWLIIFQPVIANAQSITRDTYTITGNIKDYSKGIDSIIYLKYEQSGKKIIDSSAIKKGLYQFKVQIDYPVLATLELKVPDSVTKYHNRTYVIKDYAYKFYLDKGKMTVNTEGKLYKSIVTGSNTDTERQELQAKLKPYYDSNMNLYSTEGKKAYKDKDSLSIANYRKKADINSILIDSISKEFMFNHPESGAVLDRLDEYTRTSLEPDEIEPFFIKIRTDLKNSERGKRFAARIEKYKSARKGIVAPDFILKNREGKEISLSSLKGKLVLIDFWGSWCGPCRSTHPHLRKLYADYKEKGFEILGVAYERGPIEGQYKKWTNALDEDKMTWLNVKSETGVKGKDAVELFNVNAFPTKILVDKNGVILKRFIGSGASAEAVEEFIKQYLN